MVCGTVALLMTIAGFAMGASSCFVYVRCQKDVREIRDLVSSDVVPEATLVQEVNVVAID